MVHHAIALGLRTITLILVKDALNARGFKLMLEASSSLVISIGYSKVMGSLVNSPISSGLAEMPS